MFCNHCGSSLPDNANFCNKCGGKIRSIEEQICPNCKAKLLPESVFCNKCGTRFGASAIDPAQKPKDEEILFHYQRGMECLRGNARKAAYPHFRIAAFGGHTESQYCLACLIRTGDGDTNDSAEAAKWFYQAASRGHAGAQYNLFRQCVSGAGVARDFSAAVRWLRLSADQNYTAALQTVGFLYDPIVLNQIVKALNDGSDDILSNAAKAKTFYMRAAESGSEDAQLYLDRLDLYERFLASRRDNDTDGIRSAIGSFFKNILPFFQKALRISFANASPSFPLKYEKACSYAAMAPDEFPLIIVDSSFAGNGRSGIMLTTEALYFKEMMASTEKFPLEKLPKLAIDTSNESLIRLSIGGTVLNGPFPDWETVKQLIFIIHHLADAFCYINRQLYIK